jgi:type III secretion protein R
MSSQSDIHPSLLIFWSFAIPLFPVIVGTLTSSIKVSIVLGMLRNAFGVQGVPSKMVEFALSLGITVFVMAPVFEQMSTLPEWNDMGLNSSEVNFTQVSRLSEPWRDFLFRNTGARELGFIRSLRKTRVRESSTKVNKYSVHGDEKNHDGKVSREHGIDTLIPGFILSELNSGFRMGFSILLPFLVLDLIVANLLVGLGLSMVSPTLMAFPLKIILFLSVDGWILITRALILSYN